jgi:hypothetical protein
MGIRANKVASSTRQEGAAMRLTLPSTPALRSQGLLVTQEHSEALLLASLSC